MKNLIYRITNPITQKHWVADFIFAAIRFICGMLLAIDFGASKFGMPWSPSDKNLSLFEVVHWFPQDIAAYGGIFEAFPVFFAWMGAFSEAVGGIFLAIGLKTRVFAFLIMCTMLVAILFQKSGQGTWGMLPAMGFLWISIYHVYLGSGRFGIDYLLSKRMNHKS